jgi:hypothetical protein
MTPKKHRCGGALVEREVQVVVEDTPAISIGYTVQGYVCNKCYEQLIDGETALQLQASQTPTIAWRPERADRTWWDATRFDPLTDATPAQRVA